MRRRYDIRMMRSGIGEGYDTVSYRLTW